MLHFFDPKETARVDRGHLPHWHQRNCAVFVTFRTSDSVPAAVMKRWRADQWRWLRERTGGPPQATVEDMLPRLSAADQAEFDRHFAAAFEDQLDRGFGACVLRRPELAEVVADALKHFDGVRYELGDFVVMPNHVHAIFGPLGEWDAPTVCESWKRFTAREINRRLGRRGRLWQPEGFDHLVRSADHLTGFQRYIQANPVRAGLREGEYLLGCGSACSDPLP